MGQRRILAFLVIVAAFTLLSRLARAPLAPPPLPSAAMLAVEERGDPIEFVLPDLAGRAWRAADWRGRVVLLNFWATWCEPCREELPALESLHRELSDEGLEIVAVSLDAGPAEAVSRFVEGAGTSFRVLHDAERELADRIGVRAYPTTLLLDREGRVLRAVPSAWDWAHPDTVEQLRALLAAL